MKGTERLGVPAISEIQLIHRTDGKVTGRQKIEGHHLVYRCGSTWMTDQVIEDLLAPRRGELTIEIRARAKKCMNPTVASCRKMKVVASGVFTPQELNSIRQHTASEVLSALSDSRPSRGPRCR